MAVLANQQERSALKKLSEKHGQVVHGSIFNLSQTIKSASPEEQTRSVVGRSDNKFPKVLQKASA